MPLHFLLDGAGSTGDGAPGGDTQPGDVITLTGAEAHHAATVRRVRAGEAVTIGDGRGMWLSGLCESVAPREVAVRVTERIDHPPARPRVVLVQALAKGDRDELAVQAATELGVDEIVPWQAARSVSRWDSAKAAKGRVRWEAIVREAAKQAHRAWVPDVSDAASTREVAARAASARVLVLDPTGPTALSSLTLGADDRDVVLVVGPEGGVSPEELATFASAGGEVVRLGETVLRTSTAGPAALAVVSVALGRW